MPLDARAQRFLDLLAASTPTAAADLNVEERRRALAALMQWGGPAPPVVAVSDGSFAGPGGPLGVRIYSGCGDSGQTLPGIVYFHGGGLVAGSVQTHDTIARWLATSARCRVVSVDYRLAPEHPFPAAVEDAVMAVRHVVDNSAEFGIDAAQVAICGDSAGGSLAAAACQILSATGTPLVMQILLCPILDYAGTSESRRALGRGYFIDEATLAQDLTSYLATGGDPADPKVSPLRATGFAGLPPTILHTAEYDPLRDEGREYADRLAAAGSSVSHTCHAGMIHLFYGLGGLIPYARVAWERIGADIRGLWGSGGRTA